MRSSLKLHDAICQTDSFIFHARSFFKAPKTKFLKYGPSLRGPCVKNEGLVFHGTARAIRLINSLLNGKNESSRTFTENLPTIKKKTFHEINPKSFS